jgi:hypothetical protein
MVWNCPHCRAALALSDELLGSSWNMSKCPNCENSGFIRRPGNLAIKVDKVPAGEKILVAKSIAKPAAPVQPAKKSQANLSSAPRMTATAPGKEPWPVTPLKPIIRRAIPKKSKPPLVAAMVSAPVALKPEEPTKMVSFEPEAEAAPTKIITPPEFTREIIHDSGLIDKAALTRSFEIPKMQMMMAVGHSVKGKRRKKNAEIIANLELTKSIPLPEPLPDLPPPSPGMSGLLSEISAVVPTIAFLVISGLVGWNAVRYVQGGSERHEIVDHLNSHAMAPVRGTRASSKDVYAEKYSEKLLSDDPTQVRTRTTEVQAYTGPGVEYKPTGVLQPGHLYSILEKDGNWIKFALDKTHAAWVSIAGVDLIR